MPTLLIDGTTTNYANITDATAAIAAQAATGCMAEGTAPDAFTTRTVFTSTFTAGTFAVTSTQTMSGGLAIADNIASRIYITVADGLTTIYNISTSPGTGPGKSYGLFLYEDDQTTLVDSVTGSAPISGTFTPTIPSDGYYWINATASEIFGTASSITLSSTGGTSLLPCTVQAAYDDGSGGTAYVACV